MMKRIRILLICSLLFVMSACSTSQPDFESLLNRFFAQTPSYTTNQNKTYYNYYLPPNVGNLESTLTSNIFVFDNTEVILNLDIASVIQEVYFEPEAISSTNTTSNMFTGSYTDDQSINRTYAFYVYDLGNQSLLIRLQNSQSVMVSIVKNSSAEIVLNQMVTIFKSITIDQESIVNDFTIKNSLVYNNVFQDFFAQTPPVNSSVKEMMCSMTGSSQYCEGSE